MPRLPNPRVEPVAPEDWGDDAQDLLARFRQGGPQGDGAVHNIFRTLIHHPKLLERWLVFGNHVLFKSTLPPRERELAILRVGWLCNAEYEWAQHVRIGKRDGLSDAEIERIPDGPTAAGWSRHDALILQAVDELNADYFVSDETWAGLSEDYSTEQLLDLLFAVGQYTLVSMVLNSTGVQLDEGLEGFPPSRR